MRKLQTAKGLFFIFAQTKPWVAFPKTAARPRSSQVSSDYISDSREEMRVTAALLLSLPSAALYSLPVGSRSARSRTAASMVATDSPLVKSEWTSKKPIHVDTWVPKAADMDNANKQWWVIDAEGMRLGRMATEIAKRLMGKHKVRRAGQRRRPAAPRSHMRAPRDLCRPAGSGSHARASASASRQHVVRHASPLAARRSPLAACRLPLAAHARSPRTCTCSPLLGSPRR